MMEPNMNTKVKVAERIIDHIDRNLSDIEKAIGERLEAMREAETRNQSRYDTKGWEAAREAEGAEAIRMALEQQKRYFLQFSKIVRDANSSRQILKVSPGSLVELKDHMGKARWIFLVACSGGIEMQDVDVVSVAAPFARRILNLQVGSEVVLNDGKHVVSQIL
jgi:transcription elongation GreA/GreB family factor